jgi:alcohol dehydrogenase
VKTLSAVLRSSGKPAPYASSKPLSIEELQLDGPGPGELLIETAAAGLCHSDLSVIDGSRPRPLPMALGHEASGIVREVGSGVDDFKAGDRVILVFVPSCGRCARCASGRPALCDNAAKANGAGTLLSGARRLKTASGESVEHHLGVCAFSRYLVAARESAVKLEADIPLERAALFGCAVLTGVGAAINTAALRPGESAAVFGLGGVGLSAVMGARAAGARTIVAVDRVPAKLELAKRLGATHVVDASKDEPVKAVKDLSGGGVDCALEAVGHEAVLAQAYAATGRGGRTVTAGLPHPSREFRVPAVSLVAEERTVMGSYMGSCVPRRDIPRYIALYQAGLLPVDLLASSTLRLEGINEAFDVLAKGEAVRQLVLF